MSESDDPAGGPDPRVPRAVLAVLAVLGVQNAVGLAWVQPEQVGIATDVYYHAARTALAGGDFYAVSPPDHPGFRFLYPPALVVVFLPFVLLGPLGSYALWTVLNLATGLALGVVLAREVADAGVDLARRDRLLVAGAALVSAPAATTVVLGQVNLQLALATALGVRRIERREGATGGVALGGAAAVKLFPALVGVWLLRRRAWRAVAGATATGLATLLAGLALFDPGVTVAYVTETLAAEAAVGSFAGGTDPAAPYVTVRRQLAALAPWLPADWRSPAAFAVLAPVVAAASLTVETRRDRLVALEATLLAILLAFPLEAFYFSLALYPTVPLLYLLDPGRERSLFAAGTVVAATPVTLTTVETWIAALPVGPGTATALREAVTAALGVALPPAVGTWAMLAACVLVQVRTVRRRRRERTGGE